MTDYIISSKLSNETVYAYYRGRFWRWDGSIWKESHLMTQKFERAKAADKKLTPQEFLTNDAELLDKIFYTNALNFFENLA